MADVNITNITNDRFSGIFEQLDTENEFKFYAGVPVVGSKKIRATGTDLEMLRCVAIGPEEWVASMSIGDTVKIGDITGDNVTVIEADGSLTMRGSAMVWEDIVGSLIGRTLSEVRGTIDYDYEENAIKFQPNGDILTANDRIIWNYQHPHKSDPDGSINMHVHYEQTSADAHEFTMMYRVQGAGLLKDETWITTVIPVNTYNRYPYVSGTLNQVCILPSVSFVGLPMSAQVQFRFTRSDGIAGDILATFIDGHFQSNDLGSSEEFVK